ncbi:helix-turn-helix domain-containing protein [Novosphingobium sp. SG707]|uniref:helix-turn-helix domain-containing protein n=1 Tax=Novosphingobium sp. SG707 TaxID=2586996 RepID=UPI00180B42AA|nr:helix-turn-helix domain-containing protein [Novosphingobium sp. SG707]NKJ02665.1 hypothetical protein [Novosphingobium sp. SG707]
MTIVAFLAETPGSATIEEQKALVDPDDFVVVAENRSFSQLADLLAQAGVPLQAGDRIKIHALNCLGLSTDMLVRAFSKLLQAGVCIELLNPPLVIEAGQSDSHLLIDALDGHYRHIHGIKTHPTERGQKGRRPVLTPEQIPSIRARMAEPGVTASIVAKELGIGRSTLFGYLERFERDGCFDGNDEVGKGSAEDASDQGHIPEGDAR